MRTTLALTEETWSEIVSALEEPRETAAFLLAGFARGADALTLLGRTLRWVAEERYLVRTATRLTIPSAGFVPSLATAAKDKSVPVFVHTHPGGDPTPSARDAKVDRQLRGPALVRSRQPFYVSLIVGGTRRKPRFTGSAGSAGRRSTGRSSAASCERRVSARVSDCEPRTSKRGSKRTP